MGETAATLGNKISQWLEAKLEELDCFLVDIKYNPSGDRIQVFVDADAGIPIDTCAEISRYLEFHLDHEDSISKHYNLEVSSPGLDKPFKIRRQYLNHIGKEIDLLLLNGQRKEGLLKAVEEELLVVEVAVPSKNKKKKALEKEQIEIRFDELKEARQKISFK